MTEDNKLELTRRKILGATGAIGIAGAGAGLGTSALFSDQEAFQNNSITAGTLDMSVDAKVPEGGINDDWAGAIGFESYDYDDVDGEPGIGVALGDMKPGDWVILCYELEVETNPACLGLKTENTANDENSVTEPEADRENEISGDLENPNTSETESISDPDGEGELAQRLEVTVYDDLDQADLDGTLSSAKNDALSNEQLGDVTLKDVWDAFGGGGAIAADTQSYDFYVLLELPTGVGNEVQSDSVEWDFVFDAVQSRNNECGIPWEVGDCEPECSDCNAPDPGTDNFSINIESIDDSAFPTVEATARVDTTAGGEGDLGIDDFDLCEETLADGTGSGLCGQQIQDVTFGGEQEETLADIMLVIDTSGSMGGSKLTNAQNGAVTLVGGDEDRTNEANNGGFDPTVNVGLVEFSSSGNLVSNLGTDQNQVEDDIDSLTAGGGTDVGNGISVAQSELNNPTDGPEKNRDNAPDFMIVLGNGDTSDGESAATSAKNAGTTIYGIAYGSGASVSDFEDISGEEPNDDDYADYTFNADEDDITDIFDDIASEIFGTYTLEYEASNCEPDGTGRDVLVYVDDPDEGDADATGSYTAPSN